MALLDSFIMVSCMGMSGQQNDACLKAMEAGFKQAGLQKNIESYEDRQVRLLEKDFYSIVGKDHVMVVGGVMWVTRSLIERKVTFDLPNLGLCDRLSTQVDSNAAQIVFKWNFH